MAQTVRIRRCADSAPKTALTRADTWSVTTAKTITFSAPCRNGHRPTYTYSAPELRELLQTASLRFHCDRCVATRPPTAEETLTLTQRVLRTEWRVGDIGPQSTRTASTPSRYARVN